MTAHLHLHRITQHPCTRGFKVSTKPRQARWKLHIAVLVGLTCFWTVPTSLSAQRSEREAQGVVSSIAGTIYNLAWPTAQYEDVTLGELRRVDNGWDVPVVLYGRSAFGGGLLWLELVVELRNGALHDVRLGRDNHILTPPFATLATTAAIVAAVVEEQQSQRSQVPASGTTQRAVMAPSPAPSVSVTPEEHDRRDAAMLVGTWRDENSVFTYYANGQMTCVWNSGERMYGSWSIRNDTLTWHYADGDDDLYVLEALGTYEHRTRSLDDGSVWNARRLRE